MSASLRAVGRLVATAALLAVAVVVIVAPASAPPAAAATSMDQVRRFAVPATTLQVVLVRSSSWSSTYATVEFFERASATAPWVAALAARPGRVGRSGMKVGATRHQGDGSTPAGIYALPSAFGGAPNPGTAMPYRQLDGNDWWPADPQDPATYNVYQTSRTSSARWRTSYAEHLADFYSGGKRQYAYSVVLDFNLPAPYGPPDTRRGGAIFFHVNGAGSTAGCISISEPAMASALRWLRPSASPVMITGPTSWLDDAATTTTGLTILARPASYQRPGSVAFTIVARPARLQWWRFTVTNACTGATVVSSSGDGDEPVVARWAGTVAGGGAAPPGLYRLRVEAGTATWTPQASLSWPVEIWATGTTTPAGCPADRVSGTDRYATAVAVARTASPGSRTVVLAAGEDAHLVDGLAAGPLAAHLGGVLLLTPTSSLAPATATELTRRGVDRVVVVGAAGAVSEAVLTAVRHLGVSDVRRIGGASRYETAAAVAREVGAPDGAVFVASGADASLVDALAASGPATALRRPILLTAADQAPAATTDAIADLGVSATDVVGGPGAVGDGVLASLPSPRRLAGTSRYETAAAVAGAFVGHVGSDNVVLAAGAGALVDALPGGTLGRLVLLTGPTLPTATTGWLSGHGTTRLTLVGGPSATTPSAVTAAIAALGA